MTAHRRTHEHPGTGTKDVGERHNGSRKPWRPATRFVRHRAASIPDGVAPAAASLRAAKDALWGRHSVLEQSLASTAREIDFHPLGPDPAWRR
jgi:hypothetical protein